MTTIPTLSHVWHLTYALLGTNTEDTWERYRVIKRTAQFTFVQRVPECEETVLPEFRQSDPVRLKTADLAIKGHAWSAKTREFYHVNPRLDECFVWRKSAMGYMVDSEATKERDHQKQAERERDPSYLTDRITDVERDVMDLMDGRRSNQNLCWWLRNRWDECSRLRAKLKELGVRK